MTQLFSAVWLQVWALNYDGMGKSRGEGLLKLRKSDSTFNFVDWQMGQPVPFLSCYRLLKETKKRSGCRGERDEEK